MTYTEFIETLSLYMWSIDIVILLIVLWFSKQDREFKSTLVTLLVVVVIDGLGHSYVPDLKLYIRENKPPEGDIVAYNYGLFAWYCGFMVTNTIAMFSIYRIHTWYKIQFSLPTYAYLLSFLCLSILQAIRYSERLISGTDFTAGFYKAGVLSINVGVSITTLAFVIGFLIFRYIKKSTRWSL